MAKQRVKFTFEETLVKQPVIFELGQKFKLVTNIRRADVGEDVGDVWAQSMVHQKDRCGCARASVLCREREGQVE